MPNKYSDNLREYVGDMGQIAFIQESRLMGGRTEGVRAARIVNGSGLDMTVLPGRGMDIPYLSYKGIPLHFTTGTGITSSAYHNDSGTEWLRGFYAGALTTCGMTYFGQPQNDRGKELGLHGRIANTPAEDVGAVQEWQDGEYVLKIRGVMREAAAFGENLTLTRVIETKLGQKGFCIRDRIRNKGFSSQPLMLLYHFNFGFPFLNPRSLVLGPILGTQPGNKDSESIEELEKFSSFCEPRDRYPERLFFHKLGVDDRGKTLIALVNLSGTPAGEHLGAVLRFDLEILPYLTEWKMMEKQNYVLGLEPCTCLPLSRESLRQQGKLPMIQGQSEKEITIEYQIIDSQSGLDEIKKEIQGILEKGRRP